MNDTLASFLLARIAEDELAGLRARDNAGSFGAADHVVRWSPARVLAEVEAKRRIVERARNAEHWVAAEWDNDYDDDGRQYAGSIAETWQETLRLLALPYAGHPDYRDEWRP